MIAPKVLAFYLPQFHPIPENDKWWGKGFTEWTNVTKAKPLFKGHLQPKFPADLGYYDLRVPEVREQQAEMAKEYGVDGFVYYHYWFGNGKRLLNKPFDDVLASQTPNFPFCLCWANETWSGVWHGAPNKVLIKQEYPGIEDEKEHFKYLFNAFKDPRYIKVDGKPLFMVYNAINLPNPKEFAERIKTAALKAGFVGVYLMTSNLVTDEWDTKGNGFDGKVSNAFNKIFAHLRLQKTRIRKITDKLYRKDTREGVQIVDHSKLVEQTMFIKGTSDTYPIIVPNWDNTPRSGERGVVLLNSTPEVFELQVKKSIEFLEKYSAADKIIFVKSWNEWAEGNYLEPDTEFGFEYLEVIKKQKENIKALKL
ncbi:glycoside hydrolase family 99-like domain-containing protein [uncultured Pontibacter sp.]|uniref:glycosyltransferase WbsX family protein n=1 Tax=uncultured Pontibacter sp. TaxID=453356 RepID=UPI00262A34C7|nr:glycoside hydrolase family 99-like domain-containing protein [uncultured Pontibacter sp.]